MAIDARSVLVSFQNVQKTYDGETQVIRNLNLDIYQGEFLTLLGPSGSGKTTTLLMLAGFERPTGGDILFNGRSLSRVPTHQRAFGIVFQDYALFPHMTVAQNIGFPLMVRRRPASEVNVQVAEALAMVELSKFSDRYPLQLSGGQQQRVALARALVFKPALVLMDEPLGALDKQLREQMQLEIKHIQNELSITVVYVTHDQSEALVMSDRIAVYDQGDICQVGHPGELYESPASSFVARFIGESNQIDGKVVARDGDFCTVELERGSVVTARFVNAGEVGSRACVSVRPERIVVNAPRSTYCNEFNATVEELIYLGDHVRIRVALEEETTGFVVKAPIDQDLARIVKGARLRVAWDRQHCRALDAS